MRVLDFLVPEAIQLEMQAKTKKEALAELLGPLAKAGKIADAEAMVKVLLEREELGSTGIGGHIAIPHGKAAQVKELAASFGLSRQGVAFDSLDGEAVNIFFALVAPEGSAGVHLKALARISRLFKDPEFRTRLLQASDAAEMYRVIAEEDARY